MVRDLHASIVSEVYLVDPHELKFDEKLVGFNEYKDDANYQSLLSQIRDHGQTKPIYIRSSLVIDGRHRCKIAKELGIQVRAVDVDPALPDGEAVMLANDNIFGSRNNSATQLAIKAHLLVERFGYTDIKAMQLTGISNKKVVGYVRRVMASKYNEKFKIIETLKAGNTVAFLDPTTDTMFRSKSIDKVKRTIAKIEEAELMQEDTVEVPVVDYDSMLNTETAKEKFWTIQKSVTNVDAKLDIIALLNKVYVLKKLP